MAFWHTETKRLLKERKLAMKSFSISLGWGRDKVQKMLSGITYPSRLDIEQIEDALGLERGHLSASWQEKPWLQSPVDFRNYEIGRKARIRNEG